jgi:Fic family protein
MRFDAVYSALGKTEKIIALAASYHRLLWIHPFLDGNGRVARLMSHAVTLDCLNTNGLWSIARGLARRAPEYKQHLMNCDLSRRNDLDERGNLSEEALIDFTRFFIETCIDQVTFMQKLMQPHLLQARILLWAKEEVEVGHLPPQAVPILEAVLYRRGEIARHEVPAILGITDRHARRLTTMLMKTGVLVSDSPKSPLKIAFPATLIDRFMPGLFPAF